MCTESIGRAKSVIDGMIQQTSLELEMAGNVRFEYCKPSDPRWDLLCNMMSDHVLCVSIFLQF